MATFPEQDASKPGRTTADDPIQKFYWKDVYAKRGGTYHYKIVPMTGEPGALHPMAYGPAISNQVQLSPHYGALSAYFNRGNPSDPGDRQSAERRRDLGIDGRQARPAYRHFRRPAAWSISPGN